MIQDIAEGDLIFRIDDDEVAEPDVLKKLVSHFKDPLIGAVGPSVIEPWAGEVPIGLHNRITSVKSAPNMQWFRERIVGMQTIYIHVLCIERV